MLFMYLTGFLKSKSRHSKKRSLQFKGMHTSSEKVFKNLLLGKIFKLFLNLVCSEKSKKNKLPFRAVDTFSKNINFYHSEV